MGSSMQPVRQFTSFPRSACERASDALRPSPVEQAFNRRAFLHAGLAGLSSVALGSTVASAADEPKRTDFQVACMTLPYSAFPLERALTGLKSAGYRHVAWGTTHQEAGQRMPVMPTDAPPKQAKELAARCRDLGLEPRMMFSMIYPEDPKGLDVLTRRIEQAAAAGIPQVLTFGHTQGGSRKLWVERFKQLGPIARDRGVLIVVKQHGGSTGTGEACAEIVREVADPGVMVNYDAGNVMDYLDLDPLPDIKKCAAEVRSFCIKDHRNFPKDQDCGPGYGEIDHYKLLHPVAFTGRKMPLCCENIFAPVVERPKTPEGIDALARRAREFLEVVIAGLQA
jgi:sugar phosphate isomerase/epimerase